MFSFFKSTTPDSFNQDKRRSFSDFLLDLFGLNDNYSPEYDVKFSSELSNGCFLFMIIEEERHQFAGHVLLTPEGKITIMPSEFYVFDEEDLSYLENQVLTFYHGLQ